MSEGDIFREVEQDMRREQMAQLWRKYGVYVIATALAIVLAVGGYQGWTWWQSSRSASDGAAFVQASALQQNGQADAAADTFSALAEDGTGSYSALSELRLAAIAAAKGETENAVQAYDSVAESTDDSMLRGFAQIQAATLLVDTAAPGEIEDRIGGMRDDASPWRHSARELLALSAFKADQNDKAQTLYQELLSDGETPAQMRQRAQMMLALINAPSAGTAKDAASASVE
jgi:hypothetical protein